MNKATVLLVDDEDITLSMLAAMLEHSGYSVLTAESGAAALKLLEDHPVDLLISDQHMPGMTGLALLQQVQQQFEDLPVIMLTAYGSIEKAVEAMKSGAIDYLTKPIQSEELYLVVDRTLKYSRLDKEIREQKQFLADQYGFERIVTASPLMQEALEMARRVAEIPNMPVAIYGESGTGKELFARAIHYAAGCPGSRFVAVNCAAIPSTLLESELFGYVRGAFTGAEQDRPGKFEMARQGSMLLDEIGDMPLDIQPKILRVLEEGCYERIGSNQLIRTDMRVITTTHHDLGKRVAEGEFRRDLFHRVNRFPIFLPPLSARKTDIPLLAGYFLEEFRQKLKKPLAGISPAAMNILMEQQWPGNVRELKNSIERAAILTGDDMIQPKHLIINSQVRQQLDKDMVYLDIRIPADGFSLTAITEQASEIILQRCRGNKSKAAEMLKISRTRFYR